MVRISTNEKNMAVKAQGHSGYRPKGQDIVCSAVSILLYSYAAELLRLGAKPDIRDDGDVFEIRPGTGKGCRPAYDTVITGLRLLADEYPQHVCIKECHSERSEESLFEENPMPTDPSFQSG